MNRKIILTVFISFHFSISVFAALPQWVKTEKNIAYSEERFITAVGKGKTLKQAEISAQKRISEKVNVNFLKTDKDEKSDLSARFLKYFLSPLSYNDAANKTYYVFATADKNSVLIDIENEIYLLQGQIMQKTAILETSVADITAKIKEIDSILALFEREDYFNSLKSILKPDSMILSGSDTFEREKLNMEKKELFSNIAYFIKSEDINTPRINSIFSENGVIIVSRLPSSPIEGKAFVIIECNTQFIKTDEEEGFRYDWINDLYFKDAFDTKTVLYSNTSAGSESSPVEKAAKEKARLASEAEVYDVISKFIKSTL